jgi:hypothetical protein
MNGINSIVLNTPSDELEKVLSPFIREQFPSFVRSDYGKLILFIKSYYEWLEKKNNSGYVLMNMDSVSDVDANLEEFYSHFKSTYLDGFPEDLATNSSGELPNKTTLLKNIREFYGKKGTESAYKFLFRVLYDTDLEIYQPSTDILKVSDGEWIEPVSVKTTSANGSLLFGGKGGYLYQYNGSEVSASAFIRSVVQYSFSGIPITEFFITDINGTFSPDSDITIINGNNKWIEKTYSVLGEFYIEDPGQGYRIGDTISLLDANGKGFSAKIQQTGLAGGVKKIDIISSGLNYTGNPVGASADYFLLTVFSDTGKQTAKVYGRRTAMTMYPGYFSGNRGKISSNKKVQDSNYYQAFSYELKSAVSIDTYFDVLKKVIHPAGTKMFGSVLLKKFITNTVKTSTQSTLYETPVIGKYTPYKTTTIVDLRNNGVTASGYWLGATGDLYPLGYNPYIGSTAEVGPNGTTTSLGTVFVGNSLGYTWCYVPEDGRTAHNPIGAPLGSTTAWYSGKETSWSPAGLRGLVLWLRPENIGVCGSVVNGASVDIWRDSSPRQNHAVPPTWGRFNGMASLNAGITIDKLRPVLVTASSAGVTGISFNGGPVFSPHSVFGGATFGSIVGLGFTTGAGSSAAAVLNGQHLYLTNQLAVTDDADIFVVYRPTIEGLSHGYGLLASRSVNYNPADPSVRLDSVLFSRPYNVQDRTPSFQNSQYYSVTPLGTLLYPGASLPPVGAVGFRPGGDQQSVTQNYIVYDPHVSGVCFGVSVAEAVRDSDNRIRVYLNGDEGLNRSRSTNRYIAEVTAPPTEDFVIKKGLEFYFDAGKSACISEFARGHEKNLIKNTVFEPIPRNVLKPLDIGAFGRDGAESAGPVLRVTSITGSTAPASRPDPFSGAEVFRMRTGTSGNLYVNPVQNWIDPNYVGFKNKAWTVVMYVRRTDGAAISSASMYIYFDSPDGNYAPATVQSVGNGWYRISRTRKEPSTGISIPPERSVVLFGLTGLGAGVEYDISGVQLLPYALNTGVLIPGEPDGVTLGHYGIGQRINTILGHAHSNRIERFTDAWGDPRMVWRAVNHSVNSSISGWNGGFWSTQTPIDRTKLYRYSVWVQRMDANAGDVYIGTVYGGVNNKITGAQQTNPYFAVATVGSSQIPTSRVGQWLLVVGHIHPEGTASGANSNHPNSGWYALGGGGLTYAPLVTGSGAGDNYSDYIWRSDATSSALRIGLYGSNVLGTEARFMLPRIDLVDGTEPTIAELLANTPNTIYDISGKGQNMYALSQPLYSSGDGGVVVFDKKRTTSIRTIPTLSVGSSDETGNSTWEAWVKPIPIVQNVTGYYGFGMWASKGLPYFAYTDGGSQYNSFNTQNIQRAIAQASDFVIPTKYVYAVTTFSYSSASDQTTVTIYTNGKQVGQQIYPGKHIIGSGSGIFALGSHGYFGGTNWYAYGGEDSYWDYHYNGGISAVRVYSRTLSQQEILQNYNSSRARFGV